jgi:F-type H+-transporting ATPase subunit alpha
MANFREVQAFSQFASDLDRATQMQLIRGQRLTELLKQGLHESIDVTDQVIAIYAGSSGALDDLRNDQVAAFEKGFLRYVHEKYPDVVESIRGAKEVSKDAEASLKKACDEFASQFQK